MKDPLVLTEYVSSRRTVEHFDLELRNPSSPFKQNKQNSFYLPLFLPFGWLRANQYQSKTFLTLSNV